MKAKTALFSLCVLLTACVAQSQTLLVGGLKPGLWEERMLKWEGDDGSDVLEPIRAQMREAQERQARLPAGQRQQVRDPLVGRVCVSAVMAKDWLIAERARFDLSDQDVNCSLPKTSNSSKQTISETTCKNMSDDKSWDMVTIKVKMVKTGETSVKIETTLTDSGASKGTMVQGFKMKFLGSDCGDAKPLNEQFRTKTYQDYSLR